MWVKLRSAGLSIQGRFISISYGLLWLLLFLLRLHSFSAQWSDFGLLEPESAGAPTHGSGTLILGRIAPCQFFPDSGGR